MTRPSRRPMPDQDHDAIRPPHVTDNADLSAVPHPAARHRQILQLQRTLGNRAVTRLLHSGAPPAAVQTMPDVQRWGWKEAWQGLKDFFGKLTNSNNGGGTAATAPTAPLATGPTAPNKMHFIWLGGSFPREREPVIEAWQRQTRVQIHFWLDQNAAEANADRISGFAARGWVIRPIGTLALGNDRLTQAIHDLPTKKDGQVNGFAAAALSDILRLEILNAEGGTYMDSDNPPKGDTGTEFGNMSLPQGVRIGWTKTGLSNDALTALPGNQFIRNYLDQVYTNLGKDGVKEMINNMSVAKEERRDKVMQTTGPHAMASVPLGMGETLPTVRDAHTAGFLVEGGIADQAPRDLFNQIVYQNFIRDADLSNAWLKEGATA